MKKILFLLIAAIILTTLFGCNGGTPNTDNPGTEDPAEKRKNTDVPIEYDTESIVNANGDKSIEFSVKGKKYNHKENNLLILLVKNNTDTNYSVSVSVDFLDSTGKTLKSETQTFEGFAAGYENFFAFEPGIPFDSYTCKINVEEYSGECYAQHVDVWFGELYERLTYRMDKYDDRTKYPTILAKSYYKNSSSNNLMASYNFILIDNTGEIFVILKSGSLFESGAKGDGYNNLHIAQFLEGDLVWPEELKENVLGICTIENVTLYEKE